jgi:hypothetical protein
MTGAIAPVFAAFITMLARNLVPPVSGRLGPRSPDGGSTVTPPGMNDGRDAGTSAETGWRIRTAG